MLDWLRQVIAGPTRAGTRGKKSSHSTLSEAFAKLRNENSQRDSHVAHLSDRVNYHSISLKTHSKLINRLEKDILKLSQTATDLSATSPKSSPTPVPPSPTHQAALTTTISEGRFVEFENLTQLQQATLVMLAQLIAKENSKWIGMKTLVKSIYPGSEYNKVRTTIFEYVRVLEELGLLVRSKQGNLTFLSVTTKGMELINRRTLKKKEKLVKILEERA